MSTYDFSARAEELALPAKKMNELALNKVDLLVDLQVQAVRRYASLFLENWMTALAVTDLEGAQAFMERQAAIVRETMDGLVADATILSEMGQEYTEEVQDLIEKNISKAVKLN